MSTAHSGGVLAIEKNDRAGCKAKTTGGAPGLETIASVARTNPSLTTAIRARRGERVVEFHGSGPQLDAIDPETAPDGRLSTSREIGGAARGQEGDARLRGAASKGSREERTASPRRAVALGAPCGRARARPYRGLNGCFFLLDLDQDGTSAAEGGSGASMRETIASSSFKLSSVTKLAASPNLSSGSLRKRPLEELVVARGGARR